MPSLKSVQQGTKRKRALKSSDALPWKRLPRNFDGADDVGVLDFEELEDVEVVYEQGAQGEKIVKFKPLKDAVAAAGAEAEDVDDAAAEAPEWTGIADDDAEGEKEEEGQEQPKRKKAKKEKKKKAKAAPAPAEVDDQDVGADCAGAETKMGRKGKGREVTPAQTPAALPPFDPSLLPSWTAPALPLPTSFPSHLLRILHSLSFTTPTPIQASSLPPALAHKDIIGVAETGSGKTLAYALPVLAYLLSLPRDAPAEVAALVLCPTRELAVQVAGEFARFTPKLEHGERRVNVATLVGGMSIQKQKRLLERGADVIVATPGRLWDLIGEDARLAAQIKNTCFLIIDEADRMIESGHFEELDQILRLTQRKASESTAEVQDDFDSTSLGLPADTFARVDMQTLVFSATLSKELQRNLSRPRRAGGGKKGKEKKGSTLDDLLARLDFRDKQPTIIDLSPDTGVVSSLQESKVECLAPDKDLYLYYFFLRYPGRTLVFVSSIDAIRRLTPLLELLQQSVFPLHSGLQQRQRLRNLDRFKASKHSVLLATDVAARGLDVPEIEHVLHYHVPRSADIYVHRSGRTARANREGLSLMLISPEERRVARELMKSLGRDQDPPVLPVQLSMLDGLKQRLALAKQIDTATHQHQKANHEEKWMQEAAEALGVDLDSDPGSDEEATTSKKKKNKRKAKGGHGDVQMSVLKVQLAALLKQPLLARGISARYITGGSTGIVDQLVQGSSAYNSSTMVLRSSGAMDRSNRPRCEKYAEFDRSCLADHAQLLGAERTRAVGDVQAKAASGGGSRKTAGRR